MRTTAILSTLVLSAGVLAGCGSGDGGGDSASSSAYCKDLKAAKTEFSTFNSSSPDFDKLDAAFDKFHEIAADAPAEVSAEWKILDDALSGLQSDLEDLGLSLKDLGPITQGQLPAGVSAEDLATLAPKLQATFSKLDDDAFKTASDKIEAHAKSACDIDLTDS